MPRPPRFGRALTQGEQALWQQVATSVRAYRPAPADLPLDGSVPPTELRDDPPITKKPKGRVPPPRPSAPPPAPPARRRPVAILDASWEKRIRSGALQPERSIDLHGHSVTAAHAALDHALARAVAEGVRILLVVTGKPRAGLRPVEGRGAIRAEIGDWLDGSTYADRIASVRSAHPRHGGTGALYIILRR